MGISMRSVGPITLAPDTSILAAGELVADTLVVPNIVRTKNFGAILQQASIIDSANQGAALTLVFLGSNISLGTVNSVPNISAANSGSILGQVSFATTDYVALTAGIKIAQKTFLGIYLKPDTDTRDIYVAVLNGAGTPTYTANSLKIRLGLDD